KSFFFSSREWHTIFNCDSSSDDCSSELTVLLAIFLVAAPKQPTQGNVLAAILTIIFGFFLVTVSSRITGLIGTSSNPISGMTIADRKSACRERGEVWVVACSVKRPSTHE